MKFRKFFLASFATVIVAGTAMAQVQLNASGSYLKGTGDNDASLWGGGFGMKFFVGNHVALGGVLNAYPKKTSEITVGNSKYTSSDLVTNAAATLDFLLMPKTAMVQPYFGADAGASWNNQTVTYTNTNTQILENKNNRTYFLLAPKAGVNIGLGSAVGLFGQAKYNFTFGDGESVSISDVPNPFTTEPVSKYFTFDVGLYFRIQGAK